MARILSGIFHGGLFKKDSSPRGCVVDVGQHLSTPSQPPAAKVSGRVICDRSASTGQAAAGPLITWHGERADLTAGVKLVGA